MHTLSAAALRDAFVQGKLSAAEIASFFLQRIARYDPSLQAFITVYSEGIVEQARRLDLKKSQGKSLGKLAGVPVALKDNMHIKGELTTCASHFLSNYRAVFDSTASRLLKEEDALLIGKTNMDEFAMGSSTENSAFYPTKNPWDLDCSPGGSSGGSAAAVSARLCPIALGSDTGGSIRQPAAFCGVVGYKPTYGRVSRYGLVAFASSLDQIGPLTTCVSDAALVMEVLAKHCTQDSTSLNAPPEPFVQAFRPLVKGVKIGIPWKFLEPLEGESKANFLASIDLFKHLGATIVDVDLDLFQHAIAIYYILATAEASTNLARFDGIRYGKRSTKATSLDEVYEFSKQEGFGKEVKQRILLGTYVLSASAQEAFYKKALKVRTLVIEQCSKAFQKASFIALPTTPFTTFGLGEIKDPIQMYLQDLYTIPANLAGLPAISVPSGFSSKQLPFAIQLLGPQMHDATLLSCAHAFETAVNIHNTTPPSFKAST